jgi:type IV pilus assembly protein PilZ
MVSKNPCQASLADPQLLIEPAIVKLRFIDILSLRSCYMPFLCHGGIFVPGCRHRKMHESVFVVISLPELSGDSVRSYGSLSQVVWISREPASGTRSVGVGLHFDTSALALRNHIDSLLARESGPCLSHTL